MPCAGDELTPGSTQQPTEPQVGCVVSWEASRVSATWVTDSDWASEEPCFALPLEVLTEEPRSAMGKSPSTGPSTRRDVRKRELNRDQETDYHDTSHFRAHPETLPPETGWCEGRVGMRDHLGSGSGLDVWQVVTQPSGPWLGSGASCLYLVLWPVTTSESGQLVLVANLGVKE